VLQEEAENKWVHYKKSARCFTQPNAVLHKKTISTSAKNAGQVFEIDPAKAIQHYNIGLVLQKLVIFPSCSGVSTGDRLSRMD